MHRMIRKFKNDFATLDEETQAKKRAFVQSSFDDEVVLSSRSIKAQKGKCS